MKQRFKVEIAETYRKTVDVYAEDRSLVDQEVAAMQESGEIEWDRSADFDFWVIINVDLDALLPSEKKRVEDWARDMVRVTEIIDSDWVLEEMNEDDCMDWFEMLRDRGITVPELATSTDLWDAVQKERGKAEVK